MQRFFRILPMLISCFSFYFAAAQTTESCDFSIKYSYKKDNIDCKKVNFINLSNAVPSTAHFIWKFGDGTTSRDISPSHTYAQPGKYYVCLVIEVGPNCRKEYCDSVKVICETTCNIFAKFEWKKDPANCKTIRFINLSTPVSGDVHFVWKFGDGTTSRDITPTHTYTQPGKYYVCLVVESGSNCRKEYCDSVMVNCETACDVSARFEWKKDSANCKNIRFINKSMPVSSDTHFIWKFGDGTTSNDVTPSHTYAQTGKYNVCLVLETTTGCRKEYCDSVMVKCETECNVNTGFSHNSLTGSPLTIKFESSYKSSTAKYYWNFGDGTSAETRDPLHLYHQPGKYTVCLSIKDKDCGGTKCETIIVGTNCESVKLRYEYGSKPNHPNEVSFKAISSESLLSQTWRISRITNNSTSPVVTLEVNNPTYQFRDTGWYKVCLNAVSASLCHKEYCEKIHITSVSPNRDGPVISPNPATNNISFDISLEKSEQLIIRIVDAYGYTRAEYRKTGVAGVNRFTIPVENLDQGIYLLQIQSSTNIWISRFRKG